MRLSYIIPLALALSADAFAVSLGNGLAQGKHGKLRLALICASSYGFCQFLMPLLGAFAGEVFSRYTNGRLDNWIVLIVLGYVGAKMIADSFTCNEKSPPKLTAGAVLIQAVVTSIDALAAGVSLALMKLNVLAASVIIGVITFICCFIGVYIGAKCGDKLASKAGAVGGLLLIGIGIKSFIG